MRCEAARRWTGSEPRGHYESWRNTARDLNQAAREGKLDPVIGAR